MSVSVAGLHNVCLCTCHQNVKLMLNTVNTSCNYKDVYTEAFCLQHRKLRLDVASL